MNFRWCSAGRLQNVCEHLNLVAYQRDERHVPTVEPAAFVMAMQLEPIPGQALLHEEECCHRRASRPVASAGKPFPSLAYVFGDATGRRIKSVKTAFETARLKAHGYDVKREKNGRLRAECRQQLTAINLRFHDLRREAGSRFLEGGMSANYVQQFLDHAKLSTTSRYLNVTRDGMHLALERFEQARKTD
jgi:integrase